MNNIEKSLNIDRLSKDQFYRYKMPAVIINIETNKTVIANIEQIAKSLHRDPIHINKYLGICTSVYSNNKYFLNGQYDNNKIQSTIYDYIDFFVLCKECGNPETKFFYDTSSFKRNCNSCGAQIEQDFHRLNTTIIKDINKGVNEDTKYENKSSISSLIKEETDQSEEILNIYRRENMNISQIFNELIKPKEIKQLSKIIKEEQIWNILENIENMLEINKKEDKIQLYLKALLKEGVSMGEIQSYFDVPRKNKKRSAILKKNAEYFFDSNNN